MVSIANTSPDDVEPPDSEARPLPLTNELGFSAARMVPVRLDLRGLAESWVTLGVRAIRVNCEQRSASSMLELLLEPWNDGTRPRKQPGMATKHDR